jgi:phosphatidylinositol N-acetylglucosaminyltransferase subunit A
MMMTKEVSGGAEHDRSPKCIRDTTRCGHHYRIAMVCDFFYPNLGGVENHIYALSQTLIRRGHQVIIITHSYGDRKGVRYLPGPLKVYYCPISTMVSNTVMPTFTATLPLLRSIFYREQISIVHAHQATSTMGNEAVVYGSMMGIPTVYTDHSLFALDDVAGVILNRVLQTTLSTVDAAICVSYTCRDNFILRTRMMQQQTNQQRVFVIPNAVDPTQFTPAAVTTTTITTRIQQPPGRIKVVFVSRLVFRKGVDLLVGIIPAVCQRLSHVDFIIGGDGSRRIDVQDMIDQYDLANRVELLGSVPHAQVRDVLIRGQIFLNCSLTESFCIAILEAASCGLLVVSTNVGGIPEVLPPDLIYLAAPNVSAMVECLVTAIHQYETNIPHYDPLATHERIKQMYSWNRVAIETEHVYETIQSKPRPTLRERLACYRSIGIMAGLVACFIALTIELWFRYVEWWMPRDQIDVVPSLCGQQQQQLEQDNGEPSSVKSQNTKANR